ncbi:MAG: CotH kinase family protein [Flavobacteriales bacterium]|nr:CotH kinase family protein [Flavobacteriales bacterium]
MRSKFYLTSAVFFLFSLNCVFGQSFSSSVDQPLPDDGQTYSFTLEVDGLPDLIDLDFGIERVCLNLTHTYNADLQFWITAPDGTLVYLSTDNGGGDDNYTNTCFTENAFLDITEGSSPFTGNYDPEGNLNEFNNGQNPNGTWTLSFYDTYWFADSGFLYEWSLTFSDEVINPESDPFEFESSNLPLVFINTNGQSIPDEPGILAEISIIDNGLDLINYFTDPYTYEGLIDIEIRGQSTQSFPKKSYGFEHKDEFELDMDTTTLGFPADEDWILYSPYSEKSLIQNALSMHLGNQMGRYNSRTRFCEVSLNDQYQGIYLLMERIKRNSSRVDIADLNLNENLGDDLTGGYIFRLDWGGETGWTSSYPIPADPNSYPYYQFVDPNPDVVTIEQQSYLKAYVDSFEIAVNSTNFSFGGKRYDEFVDLESFVDNFIMNELSKNVDAYRLSSYFYKDKNSNDGKIVCGPLWDFNLSFGNADYCDGWHTEGWMYQYCGIYGPSWWPRFAQDTIFTNLLKCRWDYLRSNVLSEDYLHAVIDSMQQQLTVAADRNFLRWPILGIYVWPNATPYANSFDEAIEQITTWIDSRLIWMDENITGNPLCVPIIDNQSENLEDFEAASFEPNCWTLIDNDEDGNNWSGATPVQGFESNHSAYSYSFHIGGQELNPDNYLITPLLQPIEGEHLTFYVSAQTGYTERFQVVLSTAGNGPSDFTVVLWDEIVSGDTWNYRAADLSPWWNQNIYIAFRHFDSGGNLMLRLDQIQYPTWNNPQADCTIGVSEMDLENILIVPNPASDHIRILSQDKSILGFEMFNSLGALIKSRTGNATGNLELQISDCAPGLYHLKVMMADGFVMRQLLVE